MENTYLMIGVLSLFQPLIRSKREVRLEKKQDWPGRQDLNL